MAEQKEKTGRESPAAIYLDNLFDKFTREIKAEFSELKRLIREEHESTKLSIAKNERSIDELRLDVDNHEARLAHLERIIRESRADTEPPPSSGLEQ